MKTKQEIIKGLEQIIEDYNKYTELINKAESAIAKPVENMSSEEVIAYLVGKK